MENTYTNILAQFTLYPRLEILVMLRDVERFALNLCLESVLHEWKKQQPASKSIEDIQLSGAKHTQI